jgi:hypothetical protein
VYSVVPEKAVVVLHSRLDFVACVLRSELLTAHSPLYENGNGNKQARTLSARLLRCSRSCQACTFKLDDIALYPTKWKHHHPLSPWARSPRLCNHDQTKPQQASTKRSKQASAHPPKTTTSRRLSAQTSQTSSWATTFLPLSSTTGASITACRTTLSQSAATPTA